jgi:hypothetical protein
MVRIYQNGSKWIYEYDGEIVAVEYSREMAVACGEARVKAIRANTSVEPTEGSLGDVSDSLMVGGSR